MNEMKQQAKSITESTEWREVDEVVDWRCLLLNEVNETPPQRAKSEAVSQGSKQSKSIQSRGNESEDWIGLAFASAEGLVCFFSLSLLVGYRLPLQPLLRTKRKRAEEKKQIELIIKD